MKLDSENLAKAKVWCDFFFIFIRYVGVGVVESGFSFLKVLFSIIGASDKEGIWCHNKH